MVAPTQDMRIRFLQHFESLPGIDPNHTNHELIDALFRFYERRPEGITKFYPERRATGVTRTLLEFTKWIDSPVLVIARNCDIWRRNGIESQNWVASLREMQRENKIVIVDDAAGIEVKMSLVMTHRFIQAMEDIPVPAFYVSSPVLP